MLLFSSFSRALIAKYCDNQIPKYIARKIPKYIKIPIKFLGIQCIKYAIGNVADEQIIRWVVVCLSRPQLSSSQITDAPPHTAPYSREHSD